MRYFVLIFFVSVAWLTAAGSTPVVLSAIVNSGVSRIKSPSPAQVSTLRVSRRKWFSTTAALTHLCPSPTWS